MSGGAGGAGVCALAAPAIRHAARATSANLIISSRFGGRASPVGRSVAGPGHALDALLGEAPLRGYQDVSGFGWWGEQCRLRRAPVTCGCGTATAGSPSS